jgi:hypothetical protein
MSLLLGPRKYLIRKKKRVAVTSESSRKCTTMNVSVTRMTRGKPSAYAKPHASEVRNIKAERRYVKEGSGRWYVFEVCFCLVLAGLYA